MSVTIHHPDSIHIHRRISRNRACGSRRVYGIDSTSCNGGQNRLKHARREDSSLSTALGNVLVLERLRRGKPVVLVEQLPLVDRVGSEQIQWQCGQ